MINHIKNKMVLYPTIYPEAICVLNQILFTIGTGYSCLDGILLDEEEKDIFSDKFSKRIIKTSKNRNEKFRVEFSKGFKNIVEADSLEKDNKEIELAYEKALLINEESFTIDSFLKQAKGYETYNENFYKEFHKGRIVFGIYPACKEYSLVFSLNKNSNPFLVKTAINYIKFVLEYYKTIKEEELSRLVLDSYKYSLRSLELHKEALEYLSSI